MFGVFVGREREGGSNFVCEHDALTNANFMFTI